MFYTSISFLNWSGIIVYPLSLNVTKLKASFGLNFSNNYKTAYLDKFNLESLLLYDKPPDIDPEISNKTTKYKGSLLLGAPSLQDFVNKFKK